MKPGYGRAINLMCSKINWSDDVLYLPVAVSVYFPLSVQSIVHWDMYETSVGNKRKDKGKKKKHNLCRQEHMQTYLLFILQMDSFSLSYSALGFLWLEIT